MSAIDDYSLCSECGGSGFSGFGTGYGDVCAHCGGTQVEPPASEPLDPKDYEIACLKLRNKQLHHRIAVLEAQLRKAQLDPWAAGEGEV